MKNRQVTIKTDIQRIRKSSWKLQNNRSNKESPIEDVAKISPSKQNKYTRTEKKRLKPGSTTSK